VHTVGFALPAVSALVLYRFVHDFRLRTFGWLWLVVYQLGQPHLVLALFAFHLLRTLSEWGNELWEAYRVNAAGAPPRR